MAPAAASVLAINGGSSSIKFAVYNVIAFPIAAGLVVAITALMLKRTKLAGIRQSGKTAAPGAPDAAATPKPEDTPAAAAAPKPREAQT